MGEFLMPSLGADMEAGTLLEWYVKPGDRVKRGDIVALVDTSKANIEVEIFEDGIIGELLVAEGTRVAVGTALATVGPSDAEEAMPRPEEAMPRPEEAMPRPEEAMPRPEEAMPRPEEAMPRLPPAVATEPRHPPGQARRWRVSPLARRAAEQLGVDLADVSGSGPNGAITRADVERVASRPPAVPAPPPPPSSPPPSSPPAREPASGREAARPTNSRQAAMREAIGALMARSKREIPHYYLQLEIELSRSMSWLHETNLARPVDDRLLASVLLLSAAARAAAEMPEMNGFWVDGAFQPATGVHLGVAISLRGGGLIAPALRDADRKSLEEILRGVRDLVQRARAGRLRSSEMSDPTITVTNLGERGVDLVHGVIYPPQVALVGFGAVRERPWASAGMLGVRPTVITTLAADHRASDGHAGSHFLSLVDRHLQTPEGL